MNKIYSLLFFLLAYSVSAQLSRQENEVQKMKMEASIYTQLIMESQQVDLKKMNKIILRSINKKYLTKPNLVFFIENLNPTSADELQAFEQTPSRMRNPYLNQVTFWNKKNISFLNKKLEKNLIPYRNDVFDYGYLSSDHKTVITRLDDGYIKQHILEQKEGKIITIKYNTISEEKIFYFPYNSQPLVLEKNSENVNFDKIFIEFSNRPEKIVEFTIYYNYPEHSERFVYQYIHNQWKAIND